MNTFILIGGNCVNDPCAGAHTCDGPSTCVNNEIVYEIDGIFIGGKDCVCNNGFHIGSNEQDCFDDDECQTDSHLCNASSIGTPATCVNNYGGYDCECETEPENGQQFTHIPPQYTGPFSGPHFDGTGYYCTGKKSINILQFLHGF